MNRLRVNRRPLLQVADFSRRHKVFSEELATWNAAVTVRHEAENLPTAPSDDRLRMALLQSVYQYCRLVTFSSGLQRIVQAGKLKDDMTFLPGCLQAASAVINCVMDRVLPTGFIRYSPEFVFALSAYGTAVLIKCLRPEFSCKVDGRQEARITELVKRLLKTLDSDQLGMDSQSTPRHCYAKFLEQVLTSRIMERQKKQSVQKLGPSSFSETYEESKHPSTPTVPSRQPEMPSPDVKVMNQFSLPPSDPAFFQAWNMMESQQLPGTMNSLLGFSENQIPANFLSFEDQSWFM